METTTTLKIDNTDVFLIDYGDNKGKIIVSGDYSSSHYWGSMGCGIIEFIQEIDEGYFSTKLSPNDYVFDAKESVRSIRRYIKTDLNYELPWYKFMEAQKSLRKLLKEAELCPSIESFVRTISSIPIVIDDTSLQSSDRENFQGILKSICNEPWYFIEKIPGPEKIFFTNLLPKIKKELLKK